MAKATTFSAAPLASQPRASHPRTPARFQCRPAPGRPRSLFAPPLLSGSGMPTPGSKPFGTLQASTPLAISPARISGKVQCQARALLPVIDTLAASVAPVMMPPARTGALAATPVFPGCGGLPIRFCMKNVLPPNSRKQTTANARSVWLPQSRQRFRPVAP